MRRAFGWLALALLLFYVVTQPESAAEGVRAMGGGLRRIGDGFGAFLADLS